ncbi:MAG: peptidylprolyl isomerase [Hyphomonadaceae bacterium]|nr:peptidylprolyl isomerase [Hyphomonadaceae bacterium]
MRFVFGIAAVALAACQSPAVVSAIPGPPPGNTPSPAEVIAASKPEEWRRLDPENTVYMDFPNGRVIIELAPEFAPKHVANIRALSREGYFANGAVTRVQDNFVTQWAQAADPARPPKLGVEKLNAEFTLPRNAPVPFDVLPDPDTFAPEVGFSNGLYAARDGEKVWLAHCYGMVGAGRENDENSGGGTELYTIIGQSPRALDRQLTVLGKVVQGMEILAAFPRGTGDVGFYKTPAEYHRYADMKLAADVPEAQRTNLETMRTDSASFQTLVNGRRWRKDDFYTKPVGRIGLCNITVPVRVVK